VDVEAAAYWLGWVRLVQLVAVFLVAVGVVAEFAGEWIGRPLERVIDRARELQFAQLTNDTARLSAEAETARAAIAAADARAAEATQRAVEAQLALEKFRAPRKLVAEERAKIVEKVKPFAPVKFDVSVIVGDPEALAFLGEIIDTLELAGWTWIEWNHPSGPFMNVYSISGKPNIGQAGGVSGIVVLIHDDHQSEFSAAAAELAQSLTLVGLESVGMSPNAGESIPNHDTIHIIVGKKP
jgi:hypothetical protein